MMLICQGTETKTVTTEQQERIKTELNLSWTVWERKSRCPYKTI